MYYVMQNVRQNGPEIITSALAPQYETAFENLTVPRTPGNNFFPR
jgi:hypothetical protein